MQTATLTPSTIAAFGDFILANRDEITRHWVTAVDRSPDVQASEDLTYRQLLDHLPQLCAELAHTLHEPAAQTPRDETSHYSSVHGAKRWQQGYRLDELIREISLLRKDFIGRWFDAFQQQHAPFAPEARRAAKQIVHRFFDDMIIGSTLQFVQEQQARVHDAEVAALSAKQRAEAADEARTKFIGLVSHELRTPLTPVLLATSMLENEPLSSEGHDLVRLVKHNARIEAMLIDDLLDASRLAHEPLVVKPVELELHPCIADALDASALDFEAKQIVPEVALAAESQLIMGDHRRVVRAFATLFRNAAKVTPSGGQVLIRTRNVDSEIEISIQDGGPDFDAGVAAVFLPYGEGRHSPFGLGGLGLSRYVCKATIEAHGGTITAGTRAGGGGALFLVRLPLTSH